MEIENRSGAVCAGRSGVARLAAFALLLAVTGTAAAQSYAPSGVQTNVPEATVTGGGWDVCFAEPYDQTGTPVATMQANCNREQVMLACRPVGNPNFTLLAQAARTDVFFDTGASHDTHIANDVGWYFSEQSAGTGGSFGFAPAGEPVYRQSCDWQSTSAHELRMCVHINSGSPSTISGGYRCGNNQLNDAGDWERVVLHADAGPPVAPSGVLLSVPGSSDPVIVAEELVFPPVRAFANPDGVLNVSTPLAYSFSEGEVRHARLECPGARFTTGAVLLNGVASPALGAINGVGTDTLTFSLTAGAAPFSASDVITVDGTRTLSGQAPVDCRFGLYDFPSQAQTGGETGRVVTTSGAYLRFGPSYALEVDARDLATADVESSDPAYSEFLAVPPTSSLILARLGGFSYGSTSDVTGTQQPITTDGQAVELAELMAAGSALKFQGDFGSADAVYLSTSASCATNAQSADTLTDDTATFVVGSGSRLGHHLCYRVDGTPIAASNYTVSLAPVSLTPAMYEVGPRGPLELGEIIRNGTQLQAPLVQLPGGGRWQSRVVLTNTGSIARPYTISVQSEDGVNVNPGTLTGTIPANGTAVLNVDDIVSFPGRARATLNVSVAGPTNQIQGLYQIVDVDNGGISNETMVRPGTN